MPEIYRIFGFKIRFYSDDHEPIHVHIVGHDGILRNHSMNPIICEKGFRNHPLTDEQKANNRQKSKTRCRVEHIFGFEEGSMKGLVVRSIGLMRAKANVALTSLVYNMFRFIQIMRYKPEWVKI